MKWIVLSLIAVGTFANASVYQCSDNRGRARTEYTVVAVHNAAVVTVTTPGASELGEVEVLGKADSIGRAENGDFNFTIDKADRSKINWKKQKNCWKLVGNTQTFTVAGENSSLEIAPVVMVNPAVRCRFPELHRGQTQLSCKQLD